MGPLVPMLGGPQDGREGVRCLSTLPEEELAFDAGGGLVHVYRAEKGPGPFVYQGTRARRQGEWARPLDLRHGDPAPGGL